MRGRPLLDNSFCLILTLWMLANEKETYRQTGERFGISESTAFRVFKSTISSISNLEEKYIVWPTGLAAQRNINGFHNLRKVPFPGAFCVVDCSHIRINGSLSDNSYLNRNHYHSVIIQGICDFEGKFINVFVGYPGSSHDAAVWVNSPVHKQLMQNHYEVIPPNCFILGDSAYPLSEFLMKPYRDNGHLELHQKKFNTILSSSRVVIEQAFGSLKGRFRRLKGIETLCVEAVSKTVIAACIIHNMCSDSDQDFEVDDLADDSFFNLEAEEHSNSQTTRASDALAIRDSIAKNL
ncbi:hypothetical protein ACI65C_008753 [Semiaphis heraclei]